jgi:hypothetical protein
MALGRKMAISCLLICKWVGVTHHDTEIKNPSWPDVESAVRALNNREFNDVYLYPDESKPETYLCIGGGGGSYVATGSVESEYFPTLVDKKRPAEPELPLVVGGQKGTYPGNWVVDLQCVLMAAKSFYDVGGFISEIDWENV